VHGILERNKATVLASRPWDERSLAYPVKGNKRGLYLLTYFRAESPSLTKIDQDCRINESVLRQLVLKVEPKLVDQLVAQASASAEEQSAAADKDKELVQSDTSSPEASNG
jgi:small subunit ribosomal protein S6